MQLLALILTLAVTPMPQTPGPAPGSPLPGVTFFPTASTGDAPPGDTMSMFARWWGPLRGTLAERLRMACTQYTSTPEVAAWCARYRGPQATAFDAEAVFSSDALVLAAYFSERAPLFEALDGLEIALGAVRLKLSPQEQDALNATQRALQSARNTLTLNAGTDTAVSLPGLLPGLELGAVLEPLLQGLAQALQERAEAEAVLYVLLAFDERICAREVKDTWGQLQGHVRDWLPATCTAAHNNAFGASLGTGGTASLVLLRKTVEEDLRAIPAHLVSEVVAQAEGRRYVHAAPAARELVASMVGGVHPVRALDTLSRRLEALSLERPDTPPDTARLYTRLGCVSALPASFTRNTGLVDDASQGLVPQMDARARGLAVMLLSLQRDGCAWVYAPVPGASRLKIWAALAPALTQPAEGFATVGAELQRLADQARRGEGVGSPETTAALLSQEGVATLDAAEVALEGLLRLNGLLGEWAPASAPAGAENQGTLLEVRRILFASRDMVRMVAAAISRELATVYQLLLEHQAVSSKSARYDSETAKRCVQAEVWKAPSATTPEARDSEWRCQRAPCVCLPADFGRYGGLLVALANAQTANEVKAVILASATPVGSWQWRSDPDVHHVVSLTGMVGFGGSWYASGAPESGRWSSRLLVPFGVDYQIGRAALTWSAFVQVVDLAGYTHFTRIDARSSPRVLEAVSPGVWLKGVLPRTPFAFSVGAAYDLDAGGLTPAPAWRLSAGISIDAPLYILYRN